jgi:hypothetical protein
MKPGNTVAERCDGSDLVDLNLRIIIRDLFAKELRYLVCLDLSHFCPYSCQFSVVSYQFPVNRLRRTEFLP